MFHFKYLIFIIAGAVAREFKSEDFHRLPQLYELDSYERCLSIRDGLYCVGTFQLTPRVEPHPVYELMIERTNQLLTFNRTFIHRGYCVSERCKTPYHRNTTYRFERCVSLHAKEKGFNASLQTAQCRTQEQQKIEAFRSQDRYETIFVYAVYAILILNVIGTVYDLKSGDVKKNRLLIAWSLRVNWSKIFETKQDARSFAPFNGFKAIMQMVFMYAHSGAIAFTLYSYNPEGLENLSKTILGNLLKNGSSVVLIFIMVSSFLTATSLLNSSKTSTITAGLVLKMVLKRVLRILPVMLFTVGFASTWWRHTGDGPLWASTVGKESQLCKESFWFYAFFMNNLLNANQMCLFPSWAMAADVQFVIVSLLLTVLFLKIRVRATTGLSVLFIMSCVLNVLLAYIYQWSPLGKITIPENLRTKYVNTREFTQLHMSPWGNLPGCILGLFCAHLVFEKQKKKDKEDDSEAIKKVEKKNLVINFYTKYFNYVVIWKDGGFHHIFCMNVTCFGIALPLLFALIQLVKNNAIAILIICGVSWVLLSSFIDTVESKLVVAIFVGSERLIMSLVFGIAFIQIYYMDGYLRKFLSWRGWIPLARLSFSVAMIHWCVNYSIAARRPVLAPSSLYYIGLDWIATVIFSHIFALPVSLMIEYPMLNLSGLMF